MIKYDVSAGVQPPPSLLPRTRNISLGKESGPVYRNYYGNLKVVPMEGVGKAMDVIIPEVNEGHATSPEAAIIASFAQETTVPAETVTEPEEAVPEVAIPVQAVAAPVQEAAAPVQEVAAPVQEAAAPVQEAAAPVQEAAAPVQEAAAPVQEVATLVAAIPPVTITEPAVPEPPPPSLTQEVAIRETNLPEIIPTAKTAIPLPSVSSSLPALLAAAQEAIATAASLAISPSPAASAVLANVPEPTPPASLAPEPDLHPPVENEFRAASLPPTPEGRTDGSTTRVHPLELFAALGEFGRRTQEVAQHLKSIHLLLTSSMELPDSGQKGADPTSSSLEELLAALSKSSVLLEVVSTITTKGQQEE